MGDHMFRDLALSRDAMGEYHKRLGPELAAEQKLTAMVLQQSFWPFSSRKAQDVIIPGPVRPLSFLLLICFLTCANRCKGSSMRLWPSTMRSIKATRLSGIMLSVRSACAPASQRDKRNSQCRSIRPLFFYVSTTWRKFHLLT